MNMRAFIFASLFLLAIGSSAFAGNSLIDFTDTLVAPVGIPAFAQTSTPHPSLTQLVTDNYSHTLTLASVQVSSLQPILYLSFYFNGSGTGCIVRPMNSATKASWVAYPVAAGASIGFGVNPSQFTMFNYSSCYN